MEEDNESIRETLRKIAANQEQAIQEKKVKKFRVPWSAKISKAKAKKGYTAICYIDENNNVSFFRAPIQEGVFKDKKDIPHIGSPEYLLTYKNKPFIIQTASSLLPVNPKKLYDVAAETKSMVTGWKLLANNLESTFIKPKGSLGMGGWVIGIILLLGVGYYLLKSKGIG